MVFIRLEIVDFGKGDRHLVGFDEINRRQIDFGPLAELPQPRDMMAGRMRWKDGLLLNEEQVVDETYTRKMHIA